MINQTSREHSGALNRGPDRVGLDYWIRPPRGDGESGVGAPAGAGRTRQARPSDRGLIVFPRPTGRPWRDGRRAAGRAGAAPEGARRRDQRVPPGRVSYFINPQVKVARRILQR
jgi:hypothetical protein